MSKFDFTEFLVKNDRAENDERKFKSKDGKKTINVFTLHGRKAILAKSGADCVKIAKTQETVEYTINGQVLVAGKLQSEAVRGCWMEGKVFAQGLEKHLHADETETAPEPKPEEAKPENRLNGQTAAAK